MICDRSALPQLFVTRSLPDYHRQTKRHMTHHWRVRHGLDSQDLRAQHKFDHTFRYDLFDLMPQGDIFTFLRVAVTAMFALQLTQL